jgi:circadian clock protein KaiC
MFSLATAERPAVFFTALGEPPLKMLRYQQQFDFFDPEKVDRSIRFVSLSDEVAAGKFEAVLARIIAEVERSAPALVFVDSFRALSLEGRTFLEGELGLQEFIQRLGVELSGREATTFLVGQYPSEGDAHPVLTVADGVIVLEQDTHRNSMVRKIQILKMRGQASSPGSHTFRITSSGLKVFPSAPVKVDSGDTSRAREPSARSDQRLTMGVAGLDELLGGGLPIGYSMLVAGPSGSGKSILTTAFLAEGVRRGEPGVLVAFEQTPSRSRNSTIDDLVLAGELGLINTRELDLSIDEIVQELLETIGRLKATRVVIDSLSGFELAVAPTFREDFRESMFRMTAALSGLGVTVLMTSELEDRYTDLRFSPYGTAFLTDAIIVQRYLELESRLTRVMAVVKVRASAHSADIRRYDITDDGIVIGEVVREFEGLLSGRPSRRVEASPSKRTPPKVRAGKPPPPARKEKAPWSGRSHR